MTLTQSWMGSLSVRGFRSGLLTTSMRDSQSLISARPVAGAI